MAATNEQDVSIHDTGTLGVLYLKRLWWMRMKSLKGQHTPPLAGKMNLDFILLDGLGLGIVEPDLFLFQNAPTFEEFEEWIVRTLHGKPPEKTVARVNRMIRNYLQSPGNHYPLEEEVEDPVLTSEDMAFWNEHGYIIVKNAISRVDAMSTEQAVWEYLGKDPKNPDTWYGGDHIFWVPLFQHPTFIKNRNSPRIHKAFAQVWGTGELLVSVDRASMNLPGHGESDGEMRSGPSALHWDSSIARPMPFGVQGILYLTDTEAHQGAFQCVPGFHRIMGEWLKSLPQGTDPRTVALSLKAKALAAGAGDLIIWRHELPHGSSENRASYPRVAQYITLYPPDVEKNPVWE